MINPTSLKHIADYQLLNGAFNPNPSLLNGKMGIALFFFLYAESTHNSWYEEFAGELLDDVCNNLHVNLPISFMDGLCGIGWGIEFMKHRGIIEGDTDEILREVDLKVMERDLRRISDLSFETGLEGIATYIQCRMNSPRSAPDRQPFDLTYLMDLEAACQKNNITYKPQQYQMETVWNRIISLLSATLSQEDIDNWKKGLAIIAAKHE